MDVVAHGDVARGEPDHLPVPADRGARRHGSAGHLVARLDLLTDLDVGGAVLEDGAGRQTGLRDRDVVLGPQDDRFLRERVCRHGNPPAVTIPDRPSRSRLLIDQHDLRKNPTAALASATPAAAKSQPNRSQKPRSPATRTLRGALMVSSR